MKHRMSGTRAINHKKKESETRKKKSPGKI